MKARIVTGAMMACIFCGVNTMAEPIKHADVVSEPAWLFHIDFDALRGTVIGQHLLTEMNKPEALNKLAAFQAVFNFDLRSQLHGVTIYGTSTSAEDGVMLVHADFDAARLTTLAQAANGYQSSTHRQHTIHSWIDEKRPAKSDLKPRVYAAIHGNKVVFAHSQNRVAEALDVLDRVVPNLSSNAAFANFGNDGSFVHGAATKFDAKTGGPNAEVFRQSKGMRLAMGEKDRQLTTTLVLEVGNEEVARQLEAVCRGMVGLMALRQDRPELQRIAQAIAIRQDGARIFGDLTLAADEVVQMLKTAKNK
jgi:hypothetical protein